MVETKPECLGKRENCPQIKQNTCLWWSECYVESLEKQRGSRTGKETPPGFEQVAVTPVESQAKTFVIPVTGAGLYRLGAPCRNSDHNV